MELHVALPEPRGTLSTWVLSRLRGGRSRLRLPTRLVVDDDLHLALYLCYELHYGGLPLAVDMEWDPDLIAARRRFETALITSLRDGVVPARGSATDVADVIAGLIDQDDSPSLSAYMERYGTLDEMRQFVVHRSAYQLKEGDPHTFAIPRLRGRAKQLLVEIQAGEYGADAPGRLMHCELFASTMRHLGLDDRPNAYLDRLPASALAISNLISLFGLNARWSPALVGQLTVFEQTSVVPMQRYSRALARMKAPPEARRFYDVHVQADAEHEVVAPAMARALVASEPSTAADVIFGAQAALLVETAFAGDLFESWHVTAPTAA
jgi:hypothetical protein